MLIFIFGIDQNIKNFNFFKKVLDNSPPRVIMWVTNKSLDKEDIL